MNRSEAEQLVGQRCSIWTSANGVYSGRLVRLVSTPGRPWRGVVLIDSILQTAQHFENGKACRRGYRPGEEIEAGGVNIAASEAFGFGDYSAALCNETARMEGLLANCDSRNSWALAGQADACRAVVICEEERLRSGSWNHQLLAASFAELQKARRSP